MPFGGTCWFGRTIRRLTGSITTEDALAVLAEVATAKPRARGAALQSAVIKVLRERHPKATQEKAQAALRKVLADDTEEVER